MKSALTLFLLLLLSVFANAQTESEPNNDFSGANSLAASAVINGNVSGNTAENYDYFKTILPIDGTLKIYVRATNTSGNTGWLSLYGFDKRQINGKVFDRYISGTSTINSGATVYDTIYLYGRAADSFYFRFSSSQAFSYNLKYEMVDQSENDPEVEETFAKAIPVNTGQQKKGHIGYLFNGTSDEYDYYRTLLPQDGTLKIYVQATNNSGGTGWLSLYGFDKRQISGKVFDRYISGTSTIKSGATVYDTIYLYGRAADSFYFRYSSSSAFSYAFKYEMVHTSENDVEPNDEFSKSLAIAQKQEKKGHIGYLFNGTSDNYDYYKTKLPKDGTLKVYVQATNTSSNTGWLSLYGFDKRRENGKVFDSYIGGTSTINAGATVYDTVTIRGLLSDSFYFRFSSSQGFTYVLSYEMTVSGSADTEPNNSFAEAVAMRAGIAVNGEVGFQAGGQRDDYDHYRTVLPEDGTIKIYVQATNRSSSTGWLSLYGFDRRQSNGKIFDRYIGGTSTIKAGSTVQDTFYINGRASDTFYFRFSSSQAFSYDLKYEMEDTSENDIEPNNAFEAVLQMTEGEEKKGHIGYLFNGISDDYDHYQTSLPVDGTLKIYVQATNRSGNTGWLSLYGFDRRKASGKVFDRYISGTSTIGAGKTVYDTIYINSRAADTFYFRFSSSQAFSYNLKYEMVDTSENDMEPNGLFDDALPMVQTEEKKGHIGYLSNGGSDEYDHYLTSLPEDGTLKIYVQATNRSSNTGWLSLYGFDRRKGNGKVFDRYISGTSTIGAGKTVYDTIYINSRAADTFYFRFSSSQAFIYNLKYEMVDTSENDMEPNGLFDDAIPMLQAEEKKGHIAYLSNGGSDEYDHYLTSLPEDGTLKIYVQATNRSSNTGWLSLYGFDRRKGNGKVFDRYISGTSSIGAGKTVYDTILVTCRAADTFYFRFSSSQAFSYHLKYEMINTSNAGNEPNNSFETADTALLDNTYSGHIGYLSNGESDAYDYFITTLPSKGSVEVIVDALNTSGGNGYIYLYGYKNRTQTVLGRYIGGSSSIPAGAIVRDTIMINCLTTDTLFLRWSSSGCFRYSFRMKHYNHEPIASMQYERLGSTIGFRPQKANADSFIWDFDDDSTSTIQYPMHTYLPGNYNARLIVNNSVCNFKDTATQVFDIKGVEYYTPEKIGYGGDVNMQIFGGGLDSTTSVKLVKGSTVIMPLEKFANSVKDHLTAVFDVHLVQSGKYDVVIQIPGEDAITYKEGFLIEDFSYPYTWAEVQGPSRWRTNSDTRFTLVVGNNGNVMASGAVVGFAWPRNVSVKFDNGFILPQTGGVETVIVDNETISLPRSEIKFIYDSLVTAVPIDSFNNQPFNGYMQYLLLPHVPAGATVEIPFIARTSDVAAQNFKTFTYAPNQRGSCETPNWTNYNEDITAELIDGADMIVDKTKIPLLKAFTKTAKIGQKHGASASSYLGKKFWAWYDGYEFDAGAAMADWMKETEANNAFALQTATDELGSYMLDKGVGKLTKTYNDQVDFINKRLANNPNMSPELVDKYLDKLNSLPNTDRLQGLHELFKEVKNAGTLSDKLVKLQKLADECPELAPQIEDLLKELDNELNPRDPNDKPSNSVTSMDPNAIEGPVGKGTRRYVNNLKSHSFTVYFENVDTATAAAQMVIVRDTLDKTRYNLSSFEFGGINLGTKYIRIPKGRKEFVIERNLAPVQPMKVRINGRLDTATGVIEWQFTAIDPATGDIPVLEGFQPPNVNKPEGEGAVSYTVKPVAGLPDGAAFANRASIIFDQNEPIITNTWTNQLDIVPPASTVSAVVTRDTVINLTFNGNDAVSGIGYYSIFVKVNDGPWLPYGSTSAGTTQMIGQLDSTYSFYVISRDKVGNIESKALSAEAVVTLTGTLAVTMGNITAANEGTRNRINWHTFREDRGDHFIVEKSSDSKKFNTLTAVKAHGAASSYKVYDEQPFAGWNYYRLKSYDKSGDFKTSRVVSVFVDRNNAFALEVSPNPASDKVILTVHGTIEGRAGISLVNTTGSPILQTMLNSNRQVIELGKLPAGVYFLRFSDSKRSEIIKIVKH
ncbi:DUF7619 domain-containing protein [Foetidibacter luteolus]|uniref:DUF7619 domain-containing protein n=1 Tax=Foetidibacter luteolus TaxID=2608880 RepID=UPI00129B6418|nr:T9SS type A sorting domain-containing protein [Foetidibacter luteolus]